MDDADSPVILMIDDLTNAWHNHAGGDSWEPGGDWGGGLDASDGALAFLERELLRKYPEVRTTFFVVAGQISSYTHHQPFSYAAPLDADERSRRFFSALSRDRRFELAYHGYNHGSPGDRTADFIQEWQGFESPESAKAQTLRGLDIFKRATGSVPRGGKYGGWEYNGFAEDIVDELGFQWWCRDWMPRDVTGSISDGYYEPQLFGQHLVVGLPSTVHGHFWDPWQIDLLLARSQVISVEEHIAPIRPDGLIQSPNIVDDIDELRRLYAYLRGKNVWHATCSDVAAYVCARDRSFVYDVTNDGFSIRYDGQVECPALTLKIDSAALCSPAEPHISVTMPDERTLQRDALLFDEHSYRHSVTIPVMSGRYTVHAE